MIAIEVELLTGRYVATRYDDRRRAEWPPDPARLFYACVATLAENPEIEGARQALQWLEEQGPPDVVASEASERTTFNVFVPVNDPTVSNGWEGAFAKLRAAEGKLAEATSEKARKSAQAKLDKQRTTFEEAVVKHTADDGTRPKRKRKDKGKDKNLPESLLPDLRDKQARTFPSVTPIDPRVVFCWYSEPDAAMRRALATLLERLVRLGHSSTLVSCRLVDDPREARAGDIWRPDDSGPVVLRVVSAGQLARLERAYDAHQGVDPRVTPCVFQRYRHGEHGLIDVPLPVMGDDWVVFRAVHPTSSRAPRLRLTRGADLARALRGALLKHAPEPIPDVLSGHSRSGEPARVPHVAYVPLADVGGPHPSGAILGIAIVLPRQLEPQDRRSVMSAIGKFENDQDQCRLYMGRAGELVVERVVDVDPRATLQPASWCRRSRHWASATPVALDHNPGDLRSSDPEKAIAAEHAAEETIRLACEHIGLPRPEWVQIMRRSLFDAAPPAKAFMPFPKRGGPRRVCVHVELAFEQPVSGPVLIGAGRYFGLGLLRPIRHRARR